MITDVVVKIDGKVFGMDDTDESLHDAIIEGGRVSLSGALTVNGVTTPFDFERESGEYGHSSVNFQGPLGADADALNDYVVDEVNTRLYDALGKAADAFNAALLDDHVVTAEIDLD